MGKRVKISDVVISEIAKHGVGTFFGVTGGAAVHFFDSVENNSDLKAVYLNHEQAASFAVEAYAKANKQFGAGIFTTGPGATNAITGLAAAWLDSVPCIFISGQVRSNQTISGRNLRQVGTQEIDIISIVKPITKYAVTTYDVEDVKYHVQKAIHVAKSGRPGPVWIDIPVDIGWSYVDSDSLREFLPDDKLLSRDQSWLINEQIAKVSELICSAHRPVILAGSGVRLSGAELILQEFIEKFQIPFVTSWNFADWLPSDHDLNVGRPGLSGQRGANLALQNSDLIISIGSHLNATIVGTRPELFAREANIVMVDVDLNELEHCPVDLEVSIQSDIAEFLGKLDLQLDEWRPAENKRQYWEDFCEKYKSFNKIALSYSDNEELVNSYYCKYLISQISKPGDIFVIDGGGTTVYSALQSIEIKREQRIILSAGLCSMGSGLPEVIGVHFAFPDRKIICFVGDGSLPFNMQELQIIKDLNIPVKIFVFNNAGYVSIRSTQNEFLDGRVVGSSPDSGLHLPQVERVAEAFMLPYFLISDQKNIEENLADIFLQSGAQLCEVLVSDQQEIVPRQGFIANKYGQFVPRPIEDMYPFLDREIQQSLMLVPEVPVPSSVLSGREIDLMKSYPTQKRPIEKRFKVKQSGDGYVGLSEYGNLNSDILFDQLSLQKVHLFDKTYFDGDRDEGYGGYQYDKKYWFEVAKDIVEAYELRAGDKVLEVGCAKGFLLNDLLEIVPGLQVQGIDISDYAVGQALASVKDHISTGDAVELPFDRESFDLVLCINTLSELQIDSCKIAIQEIKRVSKGRSFITLNSWRNKREKLNLLKWNLSALSNYSIADWLVILDEVDYRGDYHWVVAQGEI